MAGYAGPDCSQAVPVCPLGCSGNGLCGEDGKCTCHPGWVGDACNVGLGLLQQQDRCRNDCCSRGHCVRGECLCAFGWYGPICAVNKTQLDFVERGRRTKHIKLMAEVHDKHIKADEIRRRAQEVADAAAMSPEMSTQVEIRLTTLDSQLKEVNQEAGELLERAHEALTTRPEDFRILGAAAERCPRPASPVWTLAKGSQRAFNQSGSTDMQMPSDAEANSPTDIPRSDPFSNQDRLREGGHLQPPENKDFGISDINKEGHSGANQGDCPENCNFHGICDAGMCFCQPGYFGPTCDKRKAGEEYTVSLLVVCSVGGVCLGGSLIFSLGYLLWVAKRKRKKEADIGYNV